MNTMHCYTIQLESREKRVSGSSSVKLTWYTVLTECRHPLDTFQKHLFTSHNQTPMFKHLMKWQTRFIIHLILDDFSIFCSKFGIFKNYWKPSHYKKCPAPGATLKHLKHWHCQSCQTTNWISHKEWYVFQFGVKFRTSSLSSIPTRSIPNLWHKL